MQDDPLLFDYNVEERVNDFVAAALAQVHSNIRMFFFCTGVLSLWLYTLQGDPVVSAINCMTCGNAT